MNRREPGTSRIYKMTHAPNQDRVVAQVNQELTHQRDPRAVGAVYIDSGCRPHEIILGPCSTRGGPLVAEEAMVHPDTALLLAKARPESFHPDLVIKEEGMADDIEIKVSIHKRIEYWIPAGPDGGRFEHTGVAYAYARRVLIDAGVIEHNGSAEEHIRIKPHDQHVIIYVEFDEEQK